MGYEVKLFAVERITEGYCSVVAEIDLCKPGEGAFMNLHRNSKGDGTAYIYGLDGDTQFKRDRYDEPMSIMTPEKVLAALKKNNRSQKYRRFIIAIAFLESFIKHFPDGLILGFGH